jgi:hypothetical protein
MPRLYDMILEQSNILLRFFLEDDSGQVNYGPLIKGPKWVKPILYVMSIFIYLSILMVFGKYLWNQGLQVAFPGVVAHIGQGVSQQLPNPYQQLMVTMVALMFIL